jgi:hypothetical protein
MPALALLVGQWNSAARIGCVRTMEGPSVDWQCPDGISFVLPAVVIFVTLMAFLLLPAGVWCLRDRLRDPQSATILLLRFAVTITSVIGVGFLSLIFVSLQLSSTEQRQLLTVGSIILVGLGWLGARLRHGERFCVPFLVISFVPLVVMGHAFFLYVPLVICLIAWFIVCQAASYIHRHGEDFAESSESIGDGFEMALRGMGYPAAAVSRWVYLMGWIWRATAISLAVLPWPLLLLQIFVINAKPTYGTVDQWYRIGDDAAIAPLLITGGLVTVLIFNAIFGRGLRSLPSHEQAAVGRISRRIVAGVIAAQAWPADFFLRQLLRAPGNCEKWRRWCWSCLWLSA